MTTATLHSHAPVRTNAVADWAHRVREAYTRWRENQMAQAALGSLSDHELKDIGLVRGDVAFIGHRYDLHR